MVDIISLKNKLNAPKKTVYVINRCTKTDTYSYPQDPCIYIYVPTYTINQVGIDDILYIYIHIFKTVWGFATRRWVVLERV